MHRTLHTWQHVLLSTITPLSLFIVREEVNGGLFLLCKLVSFRYNPTILYVGFSDTVFKLTTERHTVLLFNYCGKSVNVSAKICELIRCIYLILQFMLCTA